MEAERRELQFPKTILTVSELRNNIKALLNQTDHFYLLFDLSKLNMDWTGLAINWSGLGFVLVEYVSSACRELMISESTHTSQLASWPPQWSSFMNSIESFYTFFWICSDFSRLSDPLEAALQPYSTSALPFLLSHSFGGCFGWCCVICFKLSHQRWAAIRCFITIMREFIPVSCVYCVYFSHCFPSEKYILENTD